MKIFGIHIDNFSCKEIVSRTRDFLDEPKFHRITTINPEFLLLAGKDERFRRVLLDADLRIVDGFGIVLAGWLRGEHITRFTGADLMEEILKITNARRLSVFLAINKDGLSSFEEIKEAILKKYHLLKINGTDITCHSEPRLPDGQGVSESMNPDATRHIPQQARDDNVTKSHIVFCNFGAPAQELFLADLKNYPGNIRLAMGVGGAFDYLTGKQKRAPKYLRNIGLEWLWRLILQPKRFKRIWNATIIFLFNVLVHRRPI